MRERGRTVTVPWTYRDRDFLNVLDRDLVQYDRFIPFTVPGRSPFLTVHRPWPFTVPGRSPFLTVTMTVPDRFWLFLTVLRNGQERSGTVRSAQKRSGTVNDLKRSYCTRSRSETYKKSRSRYVHGTVTLTHQKRKKHCIKGPKHLQNYVQASKT